MEKTISLSANALKRIIFRCCVGIELTIVALDVFVNHLKWIPYRPIRRLCNMTREDGLGNWFSSTQAFIVAISLWTLFAFEKKGKRTGWGILAGFFTWMSIDDASKMHERVGTSTRLLTRDIFGRQVVFDSFPSYSWQVVFGPFLLGMGLFIVWFLWRNIEVAFRKYFLLALTCLVAAVALDFAEGLYDKGEITHTVRHFMKVIEEFLEMLGNTFFLMTFLSVLVKRRLEYRIKLT